MQGIIMENLYFYLLLSGVLTLLLWAPYVLSRVLVWGLPTFLNNYPEGYPAKQPEVPLWALRAQRAHLNMVETMPAFIAVVLAAGSLLTASQINEFVGWAAIFFYARIAHAIVYTLAVPYLRTPVYLISWFAILGLAYQTIMAL